MFKILSFLVLLVSSLNVQAFTAGYYTITYKSVVYPTYTDPQSACSNAALDAAVTSGNSQVAIVNIAYTGDMGSLVCTASFMGGGTWYNNQPFTGIAGGGYSMNYQPVVVAPSGVSATSGNGSTFISWSAVTGATSYRLYSNGSLVGTSSSPSIVLGALVTGSTYIFTVQTVASNGATSALSAGYTYIAPLSAASAGSTSTASGVSVTVDNTALIAAVAAVNSSVVAGNTLQASTAASVAVVSSQVAAATPSGVLSSYPLNDILLAFGIVFIWGLGLNSGLQR